MAISDLAKATEDGVPWRVCATCHALSTLPPKEAKALRELLANPSVRYNELAAALAADEDYPLRLSGSNLSRHARGLCDAAERLRAS
jgi:hypothetical protein